jgi:ribosomal protein S18 acetylase RimI-like enzyme
MNMTIREATHEDHEGIAALFAEAERVQAEALPHLFYVAQDMPSHSLPFLEGILEDADEAIFVAEYEGRLIGLVHCSVRETLNMPGIVFRSYAFMDSLIVTESYRHLGVAHALIRHVHRWAQARGLSSVELSVWEFNAHAIALYEELGYVTEKRIMTKQLPSHEGE